ncbi:ALF repeat-containing protein [Streptomyces sp. CA2R101]|uniref:ALF repeat-containing protein n=1 Tax=Streptomyces sp. CA2R101 TaxID=3120152 RepID=UPI00300A9C30
MKRVGSDTSTTITKSRGGRPTACVPRAVPGPAARRTRAGAAGSRTQPRQAPDSGSSTFLPDTERAKVVRLWESGGPGVRAAAEVALIGGGDDDVKTLLAQASGLQFQDDRVATAQVASIGGLSLQDAARKALDSNSPDDIKAFPKAGWKAPLLQDQRVGIAQIIDTGGPEVQKAGRAALDSNSPGDISAFLADGQLDRREQDERVQGAQILSGAGTNVVAAGRIALNGSPEDIHEFLQVGQYVARAHDREHATIAQLADQAAKAGKLAGQQTKAANDASARAVTAAKLAKSAAQKAAMETQAAQKDTQHAAAAAARAASAARQAAEAAQTAIAAAQAASNAAAAAASAASGAAEAASRARDAAACPDR